MSLQDRWLGNLPSVGAIGRLDLENHLLSGARVVLSNGLEMDAFQQGTEERKKTTSQGTSLAVTVVVAGRNTPCLREIIRHGRVFAPRVNAPSSNYPIISPYQFLNPIDDCANYLNEDRAPSGATLFENPDAVFSELTPEITGAVVGGPMAFSTHVVGAGTAAVMVSQGRTGWGVKFLYLFFSRNGVLGVRRIRHTRNFYGVKLGREPDSRRIKPGQGWLG